jgi:hypothetical protein
VREAGIFGVFGGQVNVTDGRYVYMRAAQNPNVPLFEFTQMPTRMNARFSRSELQHLELVGPFGWTHGCRVMQIGNPQLSSETENGKDAQPWLCPATRQTLLFDILQRPATNKPRCKMPAVEARMVEHLRRLLHENEAPPQQWQRLAWKALHRSVAPRPHRDSVQVLPTLQN